MIHVQYEDRQPHQQGSLVYEGGHHRLTAPTSVATEDKPMFFSSATELRECVQRGAQRVQQHQQHPQVDREIASSLVEDVSRSWLSTHASLMSSLGDMYMAYVNGHYTQFVNESSTTSNGIRDVTTQIDQQRAMWRSYVIGLQRHDDVLKGHLATHLYNLKQCTAAVEEAVKRIPSWSPTGQSVFNVHQRESKRINQARQKQMTLLKKCIEYEREQCTSILQAYAEACNYAFRVTFLRNLATVQQDGNAIKQLIDINSAAESPHIATRITALKKEFKARILEPLYTILQKHQVDPDVLFDTNGPDNDVFGIDMCLMVEESLRRVLSEYYNVHVNSVNTDMASISKRSDELRQTLQRIQNAKTSEMRLHQPSTAALEALKSRETHISSQLDTVEAHLKQQSVVDVKSPQQLLIVVQTTLRTCRELRASIETARQAESTMRHIAEDHMRTCAKTLRDRSLEAIRNTQRRAEQAMAKMTTKQDEMKQAIQRLDHDITTYLTARSDFHATGTMASQEMTVMHHLEEIAQLNSVIAETRQQQLQVQRLISLGAWVEWAWKRFKRRQ